MSARTRYGFGLPSRPDERLRTGPIENRLQYSDRTGRTESESVTQSAIPRSMPPSSLPGTHAQRPRPVHSSSLPLPDRTSHSWDSGSSALSDTSKRYGHTGPPQTTVMTPASADGRSRNVLRRKKPSIARSASTIDAQPDPPQAAIGSQINRSTKSSDMFSEHTWMARSSPNLPQMSSPSAGGWSRHGDGPVIYPELDRYSHLQKPTHTPHEQSINVPFRLATHDLPPPTPASIIFSGSSSQLSASPSTKFSESPGPATYSRDTTPTSISSQSPILVSASRFGPSKNRQYSPALTRPPVTRRRAGSNPQDALSPSLDPRGLTAVRESLHSSSSGSTVQDLEKRPARKAKINVAPHQPPHSPPPRKSSQKLADPKAKERQLSKSKSPGKTPSTKTLSKSKSSLSESASGQSRAVTADHSAQTKEPIPRGVEPNRPRLTMRRDTPVGAPPLPTHLERRGSDGVIAQTRNPLRLATALPVRNASTPNVVSATIKSEHSDIDQPRKDSPQILETSQPGPAPSPKAGASLGSRFGLFGRKKGTVKPKDDRAGPQTQKKLSRKGPAAGTGHEGYGKIGATRKRTGSTSSYERSQNSMDSLLSNDSFLADRMSPVVITGGSPIEGRNRSTEIYRTDSNRLSVVDNACVESKSDSEASQLSQARRPVTGSPARPTLQSLADQPHAQDGLMKSTLAFRRSQQRLGASQDTLFQLPQPLNTGIHASSPMTSFDTSVMSDDSGCNFETTQRRQEETHFPKKLVKRERSPRKWNIFGRSHGHAARLDQDVDVPAQVSNIAKKPVPFYAIMDGSEHEDSDIGDIREVLKKADVIEDRSETSSEARDQQLYLEPPRPGHPSERASPYLERPSRLPQVGRIPKVVSNRPREVSAKSFSRPFRTSVYAPSRTANRKHEYSITGVGGPGADASRLPGAAPNIENTSNTASSTVFSAGSEAEEQPIAEQGQQEFLRFSPRKNSESTVESSSGSSGQYDFAHSTAIVPQPDDPPIEDEIWDEYNDLIEDSLTPAPVSATSSKGAPFHLEILRSKLSKEKPMESPTIAQDIKKASILSKKTTNSSAYSADMTERIRLAFQPHPSPTTPFSVTDFVASYGNRDTVSGSDAHTIVKSRRSSTSSCRTASSASRPASFDEAQPVAQVNLRVGSMTVSKWLTFGQVLFSDIRNELVMSTKRSILVVDGLGNDDWSFYAAETYPSATFYNLSPRAPLPEELQTGSRFPLSPANHHQIQYISHADKFPFSNQQFDSVVYRFPTAAPESHYRNILTESRRVLKPGGHFELSILDADLNNMGTVGRRSVRGLKERIREETLETSLASTADLLLRLLGRFGFSDVKVARVGIPAAGSLKLSNETAKKPKADPELRKKRVAEDPPSLAEMMGKEGASADENITRMVARVGRWWYTRCYESSEHVSRQPSIWENKALLRECEALGTSLKLTVCCARAPTSAAQFR